jgi:hypothetical protein
MPTFNTAASPAAIPVQKLSILAPGSPAEREQHYFQLYGAERFRKHAPEWRDGPGDWLPHYKYVSAAAIWEYWTEWKEGMNGYISVEHIL